MSRGLEYLRGLYRVSGLWSKLRKGGCIRDCILDSSSGYTGGLGLEEISDSFRESCIEDR